MGVDKKIDASGCSEGSGWVGDRGIGIGERQGEEMELQLGLHLVDGQRESLKLAALSSIFMWAFEWPRMRRDYRLLF